jgi:putative NADH-flavin reductase
MDVLIVGATGGTGAHLVERALEEGHRVTALVRDPARLVRSHTDLRVARGDVLDREALGGAVRGHDAVLCALGAPAASREEVRTRGTANLVEAMEAEGVPRLVCMTTLGIGDSRPLLPPLMKFVIVPFVLKRAFEDHLAQEERVRQSTLDWTLVRPGHLTNGPATGRFREGFGADARVRLRISRADVADFMVRQLQSDRYSRQTVGISM